MYLVQQIKNTGVDCVDILCFHINFNNTLCSLLQILVNVAPLTKCEFCWGYHINIIFFQVGVSNDVCKNDDLVSCNSIMQPHTLCIL